jgi:hypothetical protein
MRDCRLLLSLLGLMAMLVTAAPASAAEGCVAPQGTAAIDQYCEMLPTATGRTDATGRKTVPLASTLPSRMVKRLERAGLLGRVLLALPAAMGDASERAATRRARVDPRLGALLPGEGANVGSAIAAAGGMGGQVEQGFAWTLVLTLLTLGGLSMWGSLRDRSVS